MMDVTFFDSADAFRAWLAANHGSVKELWVGFHKKASGKGGITYPEALDEALCFGWIDGVRKTLGESSYTIRFTPRKPRSVWSEVNVRRATELVEAGRMQPPGLRVFEERDPGRTKQYSYEERTRPLDPAYEASFRERPAAWGFFQAQAAYYRRTATWWVMSARREETRRRRLDALIEHSARGERLPQISGQKGSG